MYLLYLVVFAVVYYANLLKNDKNELVYKTLKILEVNAINNPKNNWLSEIKKVIKELNIQCIIENINVLSIPQIKEHCKKAIWQWRCCRFTEMQHNSGSMKKLLQLSNFEIGPYNYLGKHNTIPEDKLKLLIRFKMGGLGLRNVEDSKNYLIDRTERNKCICKLNNEDEIHILTKCSMYENERNNTYYSIKYIENYDELGIIIRYSTSENILNLSNLIHKII